MTNIVEYVFNTFPTKDQTLLEFKEYCLKHENLDNWNWKDFTQNLSDFLFNKDNQISISKSSTWGICQEFLDKLYGKELHYSQSRGGLWALRVNKLEETNNEETNNEETNNEQTEQNVEVISVRRVLNDLRNKYTLA
jgi:hypothetical protein